MGGVIIDDWDINKSIGFLSSPGTTFICHVSWKKLTLENRFYGYKNSLSVDNKTCSVARDHFILK